MNFSQWKDVAELVGLVAIVASLIFVGLQMKQSQEIAIATQYQARAEATQLHILTELEIGHLPPVPALRAGVSEEISERDINSIHWLWIQYDNHHYQYEAGFLPEDSWQAQLRGIQANYLNCDMRFVWDWRKTGLRSEFVELVESFEDSCAPEG